MKNRKENEELALTRPAETMGFWPRPFEMFPGFTPFNLMRQFNDDMERFFGDFSTFNMTPWLDAGFQMPKMKKFQKTMWAPDIEVSRTNGDFVVKADLPGLKKSDVNVEFKEGCLVLSGERTHESKKEEEGFFRTERAYGSFYRSIPLPEGFDANKATARFENGVLDVHVAVPKLETAGRKLEITEVTPKAHAKGV